MAAGIMGRASAVTVDVRDMNCAQALAQAGRALKPLAVGQALDIVCNAPDVKDDLLIWARELGHTVPTTTTHGNDTTMRIRKGR